MNHLKRALVIGASIPIARPAFLQWTVGAFLVSLILFLAFPEIDIAAASAFYESGTFVGRLPAVETVRDFLKLVYVVALFGSIAGVWFGYVRRQNLLQLSTTKWMVVLATLVVGPGLVANVLLKDEIGRARPSQIERFGGSKAFTPALEMTNQCERNCSFVSGEASSMFALFFGLAVVAGAGAPPLLALGLLMGGLAGLIRMAQGAHFLSDVVFAGIFMALTAILMRMLIIDFRPVWSGMVTKVARSLVHRC
jgi:lipid A 4'-phosphatase